MKIKVLVTGANGQLGQTLQELCENNSKTCEFTFMSKFDLDISNESALLEIFDKNDYDYCINCAAYTNVEQAEKTPEIAYRINAEAVKHLAKTCKMHDTILIHISTDYVFDGIKQTPYTETDKPNPINVYGKSKLQGEINIQENTSQYFIIRTSWLYSKYKKNFVKTIQKLAEEKEKLDVINDQIGSPTNTEDLAKCILTILKKQTKNFGLYHFSNSGEISWYDFAKEIMSLQNLNAHINPVNSRVFNMCATRPSYTVLNTNKIHKTLKLHKKDWKKSLKTHFALP